MSIVSQKAAGARNDDDDDGCPEEKQLKKKKSEHKTQKSTGSRTCILFRRVKTILQTNKTIQVDN